MENEELEIGNGNNGIGWKENNNKKDNREIYNRKYRKIIKEISLDFKKFIFMCHKYIDNVDNPTDLQYDIADFMQSNNKKICIQVFRGGSKSHLTTLYCLWRLMKDPYINILIVSAGKDRASDFSTFALKLIETIPFLKFLKAKSGQTCTKESFDVAPVFNLAQQFRSVASIGIMGQITGKRARIVIADDIEVKNNSETESKRQKILNRCEEFPSILLPGEDSKVIYLGTPQTENSIYSKLQDKGYIIRIWPVIKPFNTKIYKGNLAPFVENFKGEPGTPIEPVRFNKFEIEERILEFSKAGFTLQFLLDTTLSDVDKMPLKLKDLIVYNFPLTKAPIDISHSLTNKIKDYNTDYGLNNDFLTYPSYYDKDFDKFTDIVMAIDPAGRGKDETAYTILGYLNGKLYILDIGGYLEEGASEYILDKLGSKAIEFNVKNVVVERNMGAYDKLVEGHFSRLGIKAQIHSVYNTKQKEKRIIEILSPLLYKHHIIIREEVVMKEIEFIETGNVENDRTISIEELKQNKNEKKEYKKEEIFQYSLLYQLTRIIEEKGCLLHDDRIDSLALACNYYKEEMDRNIDLAKKQFHQRERDEYIKKFEQNYYKNIGFGNKNKLITKRKGIL